MKLTELMEKAGGVGRADCVVPVGCIVSVLMYYEINTQTYSQLYDVDVRVPQLFP